MAHHQGDLRLGKRDVRTLWDDPADELVVDLAGALLEAGARMAVEDERPQDVPVMRLLLDRPRVGELGAVVRQDDREEPVEERGANGLLNPVEGGDDGCRVVALPDEREHQLGDGEVDGEKAWPPFPSLDRIHLHDSRARVLSHVGLEVLMRPADAAFLIDLHGLRAALPPRPVAHLPHEVYVPHVWEDARIHVAVYGPLRIPECLLPAMGKDDVVDRLPLGYAFGEDSVEPQDLVLIHGIPAP